MIPRYCLDTSGLSNSLVTMPQDIHASLWRAVEDLISNGVFVTTAEIYTELLRLPPPICQCVVESQVALIREVGDPSWDWARYISHTKRMQSAYENFISERNQNRADTISLNDLSVIALAKTLALPVVSMEVRRGVAALKRRAIPDICDLESVQHMNFSEVLRAENVRV